MGSSEELREALLNLEEARVRERQERRVAEALLEGLRVLVMSEDIREMFQQLFQVLRKELDYEAAFVLTQDEPDRFSAKAVSDERFAGSTWQAGDLFRRVIAGQPISVFDAERVPEWAAQPDSLRASVRSALLFSMGSREQEALFVCVHPARGHFSRRHLRLARRFSVLASQALQRMEAERRFTDLRERLEAEARVAQLNRQLVESERKLARGQRLESIGRLAGGVAHDLNNLLSPVLGYAEMLRDDIVDEEERGEALGEITSAARRARNLVQQLLAFGRKQTMEFEQIDLNHVLRDIERLLRRTIREDVSIRMRLAPSLMPIRGDVGQIEQVLINLAVNAQDAMPKGGELCFETADFEVDEGFMREHGLVASGPHVRLLAKDTGQGMTPEVIHQIFDPFFTTRGDEGGTGLGLATVHGIVAQHGGNIRVVSEPGRGSTFEVLLPALPDARVSERAPRERPAVPQRKGTILLVEDNPHVGRLARDILSKRGHVVLEATSGEEALSILEARQGGVDLMLTDVVMPAMNGRELHESASALYGDLPVLYMSGYSDDVIADHGVLGPGVKLLKKPFSKGELLTGVDEALATGVEA